MHNNIDGDILVYRCGFACEKKEEDGSISVEPVSHCLHTVKQMINGILDATAAESYTIFLTGKGNFRNKVDGNYKANRKDSRKPTHYAAIRDYMVGRFGAEVVNGEEADDALGLNQTANTVLSSLDKDLDMIEGAHFNFVSGEEYFITHEEGMYNFYKQMLMGDSTDNIPGLYGVGKAAAEGLLNSCDESEWDELILEQYINEKDKALAFFAGELKPKKVSKYVEMCFTEFRDRSPLERMKMNSQLLWIRQRGKDIPINWDNLHE